jgi:hypothetical protein
MKPIRAQALPLLLVLAGCHTAVELTDPSVGPAAVCTGSGCVCDGANACVCPSNVDCQLSCEGGCGLACSAGSKCAATAGGAVSLACSGSPDCKGSGGDGSSVECNNTQKCELKAGARSTATCSNLSICKFDLGEGSTVTCRDLVNCSASCSNCQMLCEGVAICRLTCVGADGGSSNATPCSGGRFVCGQPC